MCYIPNIVCSILYTGLFFFNFIYLFIYLLAALGLCCCAQALSSCSERGLLCGMRASYCIGFSCSGAQALGKQASVVVARGSRAQAQWLWHTGLVAPQMWDFPGPGLEPVSPALAGGFLATAPPGKPLYTGFLMKFTLLHSKRLFLFLT